VGTIVEVKQECNATNKLLENSASALLKSMLSHTNDSQILSSMNDRKMLIKGSPVHFICVKTVVEHAKSHLVFPPSHQSL